MTHALHLTAWHPVIDGFSGVFVIEQCAALRSHGAQIGLIFSRIQGLRDMSPKRFYIKATLFRLSASKAGTYLE